MVHCPPNVRLALETNRGCGGSLLLGQTIDPIIHDHVRHLDVLARCMVQMVSADRKSISITAKYEYVQVRSGERDSAGERQRAAVNIMHPMRLDEIWKTTGATNPGYGCDLFVPDLSFLDQLEIKRQNREIPATWAPGRVIG